MIVILPYSTSYLNDLIHQASVGAIGYHVWESELKLCSSPH